MKRNCTLFALFCCLTFSAIALPARAATPAMVALQTELPASTVAAILHQVEDHVAYSYNELSAMYQSGHLTIDVVAEGYLVVISDEDGVLDSILISNL